MTDFLVSLGPWNWIILAVLLFVLELIVPGVHFLWFGLAAAIVGGIAFSTDLSWQWEVVLFALISMATVFLVRRFTQPGSTLSDAPSLNERSTQYVGRVVTVEDAIQGGRGKVRVGDTIWAAQGPDLPKGATAKVTGTNGTVLIVKPA